MNEITYIVDAPSRIHFGLFSVGGSERKFGGMGMMIDSPRTRLRSRLGSGLSVAGLRQKTVRQLVDQWFEAFGETLPDCESVDDLPLKIELLTHPPLHSGFGSGTQLAYSVATIMFHTLGRDVPTVEILAQGMSRGRRSAIGSYGFAQGGFVVDAGIAQTDSMSPLGLRCRFPDPWRVVLVYSKDAAGLHGPLENLAFDALGKQDDVKREKLVSLCKEHVAPAIRDERYDVFGTSLYEFNRLSGEYFAQFQHGCYHSEFCEQVVNEIRKSGVDAVGQSSWGPCVFAIVESSGRAKELVCDLEQKMRLASQSIRVEIVEANNTGAKIEVEDRKAFGVAGSRE